MRSGYVCRKIELWRKVMFGSKKLPAKLKTLFLHRSGYANALKVAKVIPTHKSGDTSNPSNYRPISILPHFSKIFEQILLKDLQSFLDKNNILCPNQFGFRKRFSTVHALMSLNDIITSKREENLYTCAIFLDLKKAFDRVDHSIFMKKLYHFGIRGNAQNLFASYLSNRKQFVTTYICVNPIKNI